MQIRYDLELTENRPPAAERALALAQPVPLRRSERSRGEQGAFDTLLHWAFRMLRRFEGSSR